jgi:predicted permease
MNVRRRMENDLDRDIRDHIEMETRDNIERGMPPDEARSAALRKFGNTLRIMEDTRAVWRWAWADRLLQDVRHGLRGLRRNPVFAAVVMLTLALGIGMNTAVFSVINAVLIKPLPYPDPQRLVWLSNHIPAFKADIVHAADYLDWRAQSQSFDKMFDYGYRDSGQSTVAEVNSDFWPVSGVRPLHGRLFAKGDGDVVVLAYPLFKRRFGADSSIVGKTVLLEGQPVTVVGVLPENFRFVLPTMERPDILPKEVDAYVPSNIPPETQRGHILVYVVARLKPGVSLQQARSELETIQARIARQNPGINYKSMTLKVIPLQDKLVGDARPALLILSGAVACVLLIACANVAGLLLARAAARRREVAIRAAVGAGRLRMIAQFLTEAMVLAVEGGAAGLLVARGAIAMLLNLAPRAIPRLEGTVIDGRVLAFALILTLASALLFGLGPALSLARANLQNELKEGRKIPSGGLRRMRPRNLLVASEIAIALVLTIGAGLMLKSLWRMNARPPGFNPEKILTMKVSLTGPAYRARQQQIAYFEELIGRLGRSPGAVAAGTVFSPVRGVIQFERPPQAPHDRLPRGIFYSTSPVDERQ